MSYRRSFGAVLVELAVNKLYGYILDTPESTKMYLKNRSLVEDNEYILPKRKYKSRVYETRKKGCKIIVFDGDHNKNSNDVIMYVHGGGYAGEMTKYHAIFCDNLAKGSKRTVIAPIYPLAPNHTYQQTYDIILDIYKSLISKGRSVILTGDSAGGGFAAAFCQYLNRHDIPGPQKLILISPWLDLSMSGNNYKKYEAVDPILKVEGLIVMGKAWAGDTDTKHYMLSPIYGNIDCLPRTLIFAGTREVFYPDIVAFYKKFSNKEKVRLIAGRGMNHVYPLYPVPEAKKAMRQIISFVNAPS